MKPTSPIALATKRDNDNSRSAARRIPTTDYHYQSILLDSYRGHCANASAPSFRNISRGYFENEARYVFAGEAAFFMVIVITSALPILNSIHALSDFIRVIGAL